MLYPVTKCGWDVAMLVPNNCLLASLSESLGWIIVLKQVLDTIGIIFSVLLLLLQILGFFYI